MSLKRDSANLRDEDFLINKTEARNVIRAANSNTFFEIALKISIKTSFYYMTITAKSLRQQKLSL